MLDQVRAGLEVRFPKELVNQLLETYIETKRQYYLAHLRPNEVEGGRFAEAVFRLLEVVTKGSYTPLSTRIKDFEKECEDMRNLSAAKFPESIRLHIPRTLRLIYDIRNKRDAAHLADGIDPNVQDATFVVSCCDWLMAELVRLFHGVTPDQAHTIVAALVERKCPTVQPFGEFLKTLNPRFGPSERILVLLYERANLGATELELKSWLKPNQRPNLGRTLHALEHDKDLIVNRNDRYFITRRGVLCVEQGGLLNPPTIP